MPFIGIISEENQENCIRREILNNLDLRESSVLFIKEKSIEDILNIEFETIVIARKFEKIEELKELLKKSKYIIVNSDIETNLKILEDIEASIITYGFNSKATITASSVGDDEILLCIQRNITNNKGKVLEPQEIKVDMIENTNCTLAVESVLLIYKNN